MRIKDEIIKDLVSNTNIHEREINKKESYLKQTIFDNIYSLNENTTEYISNDKEEKTVINNEKIKTSMENKLIETKIEQIPKPIESHFPHMEYVGTIFGTYLIFQGIYSIYLVDQHAAQERYNYEKYYELLGNPNQPITELLIPISIHFTKEEALYIDSNIDEFLTIGFKLESLGNNDYVIREIPLWAKLDEADSLVYEILSLLINNKKIDIIHFRDNIAKQISCKASIKANHQLSRIEIDSLMKNLDICKNPFTCPHGRPTIIELSQKDLEKMFERIQTK